MYVFCSNDPCLCIFIPLLSNFSGVRVAHKVHKLAKCAVSSEVSG